MSHPIDISVKTLIKTALVVLAIWVAYLILDILVMIVFAVIITSAVDRWASKLQEFRIPRILGVVMIYLSVILFVASVSYLIMPVFLNEVGGFAENLPVYYNQVAQYFGAPESAAQSLVIDRSQEFLISLEDKALQAGGGIFSFFKNVFSGIAAIIAMFVLSFYLSMQEDGIRKFLKFIAPREYESYILNLWQRTQKRLGQWLQGQLLLGLIVGVLVFIGLTIIGVPYALILALLAAILELVPMAGPIIASIPAIILGFIIHPGIGLFVLIFYVVMQFIENHVLVPTVMKKAVGLNPVVVIIALLIGAKLGGIIGMLLAVPLAAVLMEMLADLGEQTKI